MKVISYHKVMWDMTVLRTDRKVFFKLESDIVRTCPDILKGSSNAPTQHLGQITYLPE